MDRSIPMEMMVRSFVAVVDVVTRLIFICIHYYSSACIYLLFRLLLLWFRFGFILFPFVRMNSIQFIDDLAINCLEYYYITILF